MHKENSWFNTQTRIEIGTNRQPGSPRGWLLRSLGGNGQESTEGAVQGRDITVAGVWFRPKAIEVLPYPALIRFFEFDPNAAGVRDSRRVPTHQAIGCAWCVPMHMIMPVMTQIQATADLVWWARPTDAKPKITASAMMSHESLYALFEQGQTPHEISKQYNLLGPSVRYVHQKWQQGIPPARQRRKALDHKAVIEDLRLNQKTQAEIAEKYEVSRFTINKIARQLKNNKPA